MNTLNGYFDLVGGALGVVARNESLNNGTGGRRAKFYVLERLTGSLLRGV